MKKLMILGGGFLQSFVVKKAIELGYYTIVVDGNSNAPAFELADEFRVVQIIDTEACLEIGREEQIAGVIAPATDFGALTAAYVAQELGLPSVSYEVAQLIRNKFEVRKIFHEHQIDNMKNFFQVSSIKECLDIADKIHFPVIIKPIDGSGSNGTYEVLRREDFVHYCQLSLDQAYSDSVLIEDFITGQEYGVESIVNKGEVTVLGIMRKKMTAPPDFAELGHQIPSGLDERIETKIRERVAKAIKQLGIQFGSVNMDLIVTPEGSIYIIDVGARMGGNIIGSHIIPEATGWDYLAQCVQAAVGDAFELPKREQPIKSVATRIIALDAGKISRLPDFEKIEENYDCKVYLNKKIGDLIETYHTNKDNCGFLMASGEEVTVLNDRLDQALKELNESVGRE